MINRIKGLIANSMQLGANSIASPAMAGDVAYWDGSKVKTTPLISYIPELGTPVGVVVVPEGFAPDGKTRIISLMGVDENGNQSSSHVNMIWGPSGTDTTLTNYSIVPITDNTGSTSTGSSTTGYLPSDMFTGLTSYVDSKSKYYSEYNLAPSPYLGDAPNPEYYKELDGNNVLSDFNGLINTQTLVGLGTDYTAANAAYKYNDSTSNLQWYLPAMGELGYIMPRFNVINNTITALSGLAVDYIDLWSSSESTKNSCYFLSIFNGAVNSEVYKNFDIYYVRPFAILENGEDSVNLITFSIGGTEYQAEEGMTWADWVNSEYSNDAFFITSFGIILKETGETITNAQGSIESETTSIINDHEYTLAHAG